MFAAAGKFLHFCKGQNKLHKRSVSGLKILSRAVKTVILESVPYMSNQLNTTEMVVPVVST